MKRLPYIDEYDISVPADREDTWAAVLRVMCRDPEDPATAPIGFTLDVAERPSRYAIKGRHPFAVYRLVFELDEDGPHRTRLRAQTWADFPGVRGTAYRALVIGSGGHRIMVRRMLRQIAQSAVNQAVSP
jgi:hypothetical protein